MSTAIERFRYGDLGTQGVTEFTAGPVMVRISFAPWEDPNVRTIAAFRAVRLSSIEAYPDGAVDLDLPCPFTVDLMV